MKKVALPGRPARSELFRPHGSRPAQVGRHDEHNATDSWRADDPTRGGCAGEHPQHGGPQHPDPGAAAGQPGAGSRHTLPGGERALLRRHGRFHPPLAGQWTWRHVRQASGGIQQFYYRGIAGELNDIRIANNLALLGASFREIARYLANVWPQWRVEVRLKQDLVAVRDEMVGAVEARRPARCSGRCWAT